MPRFISLHTDKEKLTIVKDIENYLYNSEFNWLLDCEVDDVQITIDDNILYFEGIFYYGTWKWGVFKNGEFRSGTWNGGIFLNGLFKGTFNNGVFKNGTFRGKKINGQFPTEIV